MGDSQPGKLEERLAREVLLILGLVGLAILQATLLLTPLGFPPALVLVLVVCRALVGLGANTLESDVSAAVRWAFYGGLALDVCAAAPFGSHSLALLAATALVIVFAARLRLGSGLLPLVAVLLGTLVYEVILGLLYHVTVAALDWSRHALVILLPSVLLALVATLPVFHFLRWRTQ